MRPTRKMGVAVLILVQFASIFVISSNVIGVNPCTTASAVKVQTVAPTSGSTIYGNKTTITWTFNLQVGCVTNFTLLGPNSVLLVYKANTSITDLPKTVEYTIPAEAVVGSELRFLFIVKSILNDNVTEKEEITQYHIYWGGSEGGESTPVSTDYVLLVLTVIVILVVLFVAGYIVVGLFRRRNERNVAEREMRQYCEGRRAQGVYDTRCPPEYRYYQPP